MLDNESCFLVALQRETGNMEPLVFHLLTWERPINGLQNRALMIPVRSYGRLILILS